MIRGLSNALKGQSGEYELSRVIGFVGGLTYIVGANAFVAWNMARGQAFDLVAYCTAFPGGLALAGGGAAAAVAIKDRNVASAKIIAETGAVPTAPPAGPKVPVEGEG